MIKRVIPLLDLRHIQRSASFPKAASAVVPASGHLLDARQRPLRDLRISVTDRCNFRCAYCMPKEVFDKHYRYLPHSAMLSFEEIVRLAGLFVAHGVGKIRLTGGEPLLRKNIEQLIAQLHQLRQPNGQPLDITLTTNGSLLARKAKALRQAGLSRLTVSLDSLDDAIFRRMNDVDFPVAQVLAGLDAAQAAGFADIKVNMVVKRSTNVADIVPMARHFRGSGMTLRFIEYMDVGATNGWRMDEVLPSAEVLRLIAEAFPLVPLEPSAPGETAQRWGYADAQGNYDPQLGEVGVISSVTQAFCSTCNRARLSTEGQLYLCLFAHQGWDLRSLLRNGSSDEEMSAAIAGIWGQRQDRYSELRAEQMAQGGSGEAASDGTTPPGRKRIEMSYIGG
ncbi:MAG: GTP 3',8-cyclase MoaA [Comamonas sp.]|nr:GTP 3',8-cyclase MoaA [Comamonas sp.]